MLRRQYSTGPAVWTAARLQMWLKTLYADAPIVVVANREPFRHDHGADGSVVVRRSASGLVTALEAVMHVCSGIWVAHGAGTADRAVVDRRDGLDVPPANPRYRLRRVWLNEDEEREYYYGCANEGLWPLCHRAHVSPLFRARDFNTYCDINRRFGDAVCEEVDNDTPVVLVQDYHFAVAPRVIRERLPRSTVVAFWHIPWPAPADFEICPWGRRLLDGLLGSSIVGFQTPADCRNFIDSVESLLSAEIDRTQNLITYRGLRTAVRAYPVSIEWPSRWASESPSVQTCRETIRRDLRLPADIHLGVGVDRLDYTKGLNEKFLAVERLLEAYPEFRERFVFVQIAEPSRACLPPYRELRSRLLDTTNRINRRFGTDRYRPIVLLDERREPPEVFRFLRAADLCYVGSLHDGMNLVAKEFVAARDDERGVLVLSRFAGAARELTGALLVNPYAIDESARALADALRLPDQQQSNRMREMRSVVATFNAFRWAGEMLSDAARLRRNQVDLYQDPRSGWRSDVLHV